MPALTCGYNTPVSVSSPVARDLWNLENYIFLLRPQTFFYFNLCFISYLFRVYATHLVNSSISFLFRCCHCAPMRLILKDLHMHFNLNLLHAQCRKRYASDPSSSTPSAQFNQNADCFCTDFSESYAVQSLACTINRRLTLALPSPLCMCMRMCACICGYCE